MKVAFTSSNGETIDQQFATSDTFHVWEIGPDGAHFLEIVKPEITGQEDKEQRNTIRADALRGCAIVYSVQIGGPSAAKLVARRIHPLKTMKDVRIREEIRKLQEVLREAPPPWMLKTFGTANPES